MADLELVDALTDAPPKIEPEIKRDFISSLEAEPYDDVIGEKCDKVDYVPLLDGDEVNGSGGKHSAEGHHPSVLENGEHITGDVCGSDPYGSQVDEDVLADLFLPPQVQICPAFPGSSDVGFDDGWLTDSYSKSGDTDTPSADASEKTTAAFGETPSDESANLPFQVPQSDPTSQIWQPTAEEQIALSPHNASEHEGHQLKLEETPLDAAPSSESQLLPDLGSSYVERHDGEDLLNPDPNSQDIIFAYIEGSDPTTESYVFEGLPNPAVEGCQLEASIVLQPKEDFSAEQVTSPLSPPEAPFSVEPSVSPDEFIADTRESSFIQEFPAEIQEEPQASLASFIPEEVISALSTASDHKTESPGSPPSDFIQEEASPSSPVTLVQEEGVQASLIALDQEEFVASPSSSVSEEEIPASFVVLDPEKEDPASPVASVQEEQAPDSPVASIPEDEAPYSPVASVLEEEASASLVVLVQEVEAPASTVALVLEEEAPASPIALVQEEEAPAYPVALIHKVEAPASPVALVQEQGTPASPVALVHEEEAPASPVALVHEEEAPASPVALVHEEEAPASPVALVHEEEAPASPVALVHEEEAPASLVEEALSSSVALVEDVEVPASPAALTKEVDAPTSPAALTPVLETSTFAPEESTLTSIVSQIPAEALTPLVTGGNQTPEEPVNPVAKDVDQHPGDQVPLKQNIWKTSDRRLGRAKTALAPVSDALIEPSPNPNLPPAQPGYSESLTSRAKALHKKAHDMMESRKEATRDVGDPEGIQASMKRKKKKTKQRKTFAPRDLEFGEEDALTRSGSEALYSSGGQMGHVEPLTRQDHLFEQPLGIAQRETQSAANGTVPAANPTSANSTRENFSEREGDPTLYPPEKQTPAPQNIDSPSVRHLESPPADQVDKSLFDTRPSLMGESGKPDSPMEAIFGIADTDVTKCPYFHPEILLQTSEQKSLKAPWKGDERKENASEKNEYSADPSSPGGPETVKWDKPKKRDKRAGNYSRGGHSKDSKHWQKGLEPDLQAGRVPSSPDWGEKFLPPVILDEFQKAHEGGHKKKNPNESLLCDTKDLLDDDFRLCRDHKNVSGDLLVFGKTAGLDGDVLPHSKACNKSATLTGSVPLPVGLDEDIPCTPLKLTDTVVGLVLGSIKPELKPPTPKNDSSSAQKDKNLGGLDKMSGTDPYGKVLTSKAKSDGKRPFPENKPGCEDSLLNSRSDNVLTDKLAVPENKTSTVLGEESIQGRPSTVQGGKMLDTVLCSTEPVLENKPDPVLGNKESISEMIPVEVFDGRVSMPEAKPGKLKDFFPEKKSATVPASNELEGKPDIMLGCKDSESASCLVFNTKESTLQNKPVAVRGDRKSAPRRKPENACLPENEPSAVLDIKAPSPENKPSAALDIKAPSPENKPSAVLDIKAPSPENKPSAVLDIKAPSPENKPSAVLDIKAPSPENKPSAVLDLKAPFSENKPSAVLDIKSPSPENKPRAVIDLKAPFSENKPSSVVDLKAPSPENKPSAVLDIKAPSPENKPSAVLSEKKCAQKSKSEHECPPDNQPGALLDIKAPSPDKPSAVLGIKEPVPENEGEVIDLKPPSHPEKKPDMVLCGKEALPANKPATVQCNEELAPECKPNVVSGNKEPLPESKPNTTLDYYKPGKAQATIPVDELHTLLDTKEPFPENWPGSEPVPEYLSGTITKPRLSSSPAVVGQSEPTGQTRPPFSSPIKDQADGSSSFERQMKSKRGKVKAKPNGTKSVSDAGDRGVEVSAFPFQPSDHLQESKLSDSKKAERGSLKRPHSSEKDRSNLIDAGLTSANDGPVTNDHVEDSAKGVLIPSPLVDLSSKEQEAKVLPQRMDLDLDDVIFPPYVQTEKQTPSIAPLLQGLSDDISALTGETPNKIGLKSDEVGPPNANLPPHSADSAGVGEECRTPDQNLKKKLAEPPDSSVEKSRSNREGCVFSPKLEPKCEDPDPLGNYSFMPKRNIDYNFSVEGGSLEVGTSTKDSAKIGEFLDVKYVVQNVSEGSKTGADATERQKVGAKSLRAATKSSTREATKDILKTKMRVLPSAPGLKDRPATEKTPQKCNKTEVLKGYMRPTKAREAARPPSLSRAAGPAAEKPEQPKEAHVRPEKARCQGDDHH